LQRSSSDFISIGKKASVEEQNLRIQGLEGLVIILRTLLRTANLWQGIGDFFQTSAGTENSVANRRKSFSDSYSAIASLTYGDEEKMQEPLTKPTDINEKE